LLYLQQQPTLFCVTCTPLASLQSWAQQQHAVLDSVHGLHALLLLMLLLQQHLTGLQLHDTAAAAYPAAPIVAAGRAAVDVLATRPAAVCRLQKVHLHQQVLPLPCHSLDFHLLLWQQQQQQRQLPSWLLWLQVQTLLPLLRLLSWVTQ
jgi:hypothetical protein